MVKLLWKMRLLPSKGYGLVKRTQATLDKAERPLVKVMQEDGTESDFE